MKLSEFVYQEKLSDEDRQEADKLAVAIDKFIPRSANGDKDYQQFGKLIGDACFGAIDVPMTRSARSHFTTLLIQSVFEGVQKETEASPIASILKGVLNSAPVSDAVVKLVTGIKGD